MSTMKNILVFPVVTFLLLTHQNASALDKLKVTASFYPLSHFSERVGGEYIAVTNIMPPGIDPHEYEPTARDMVKVWTADVFLFHGAKIDPWAEKIEDDLKRKGMLTIHMMEEPGIFESFMEDGMIPPQSHQAVQDPHIWLDPLLAQKEVEIIRDIFIRADPAHENVYRKNCAEYSKSLHELHNKYKSGLSSCRSRDIIAPHSAYAYLGLRYNLQIHSITGISPEDEPSPRKISEVINLAGIKNIRYIFTEPFGNRKLAETIARESGAQLLLLHPLGGLTGHDMKEGKTYLSIMEDNLRSLRKALSCN